MAAGILPPQRREIVVRGDGNFYRAIALWRDETGDRKHKEIRRLSSSFIEQHPQVFQSFLFSSSSVEEHEEKQNYWDLERKIAAGKISNLSPAQ